MSCRLIQIVWSICLSLIEVVLGLFSVDWGRWSCICFVWRFLIFCSFCVVLVCFVPFIFMLDHFRFCMLCSYVVLDLRCNYVAFSFCQVVFCCSGLFKLRKVVQVVRVVDLLKRIQEIFSLFWIDFVAWTMFTLFQFFVVVFDWLLCVVFCLSSKWGWCRLFQLVSVVSSRFIFYGYLNSQVLYLDFGCLWFVGQLLFVVSILF